ncbi:hypothetical protein LCGC14_2593820, partial [marine sediment metagenome]
MITIDFDQKTGRFRISSPIEYVGLARAMPSRRWDAKRRVWLAPAIMRNVEYIREHYKGAKITSKAKTAIMEVSKLKEVRHMRKPFPKSYSHNVPPFGHQQTAYDSLFGLRACALFMEMRTGKTKVVIDMCSQYFIDDEIVGALVVCPMSVR